MNIQDLLVKQHLLKEELKEVSKQIKDLAEQNSAQLQLNYQTQRKQEDKAA